MKRLTLLFSVFSALAFGQGNPVPGYFTTNDGQRVDCQVLLKTDNAGDNPKSFEYFTGTTPNTPDLESIVELGLSSGEVFRRIRVEIDRSPDAVGKLKEGRNPEFTTETLFLRVLTKGKATLYQYDEGNLHRFFYAMEGGSVKQLVYKKYLSKNTRVGTFDPKYGAPEVAANEDYKQQLNNDLRCEDIQKRDIENLSYDSDKLKAIFIQFNACQAGIPPDPEAGRAPVMFTFRAGYAGNSMSIVNNSSGSTAEIEGMSSIRVGLEAEFRHRYTIGRWAVPLEVSYMDYSGTNSTGSVKLAGSTLDIGVGIRRYFAITPNAWLYVTATFVLSFPGGTVKIVVPEYKLASNVNFLGAVGYKTGRFTAEVSYGTPRKVLVTTSTYEGKIQGFAVNLGYRIN